MQVHRHEEHRYNGSSFAGFLLSGIGVPRSQAYR